jgi:hypothetical protein
MKLIAGNGKQCLINYNWGCAYANGMFAVVGDPDMFKLGLLLLVGDDPIGQLVLYEKNCGCMEVWE